jgi:uncharacterized protein YdbL (DUF1318 family)
MGLNRVWLCAGFLVLGQGSAGAIQQVKSLYTTIDLGACHTVADDARKGRICEGLPGYPVYVAEDGRRTYLSMGTAAEARRAAHQTLKSFNVLSDKAETRITVEWRFVVRDGKPVPYATIVRYFTHEGSGAGEVLVVTRVSEREACHVAYIDALANPDAIVLARKVADTVGRQGPCPAEPRVEGVAGRSPM